MKKQIKTTKKEMTVTEVGELLVVLTEKITGYDAVFVSVEDSINKLAHATLKGFEEVHVRLDRVENKVEELRDDTNENFGKVRHDILHMKDTFATKEEVQKISLSIR